MSVDDLLAAHAALCAARLEKKKKKKKCKCGHCGGY